MRAAGRGGGGGGSASKVDLLKSALEINHKTSMVSGLARERNSNHSLSRNRADSAPKLNAAAAAALKNNTSVPLPTVPVLEVSAFLGGGSVRCWIVFNVGN